MKAGGWFKSVSGCVGWFAAREREMGRACEERGDGPGSEGDRLPPSQGRGEEVRRSELSPGSRGDLFRESSSFLSGIWF